MQSAQGNQCRPPNSMSPTPRKKGPPTPLRIDTPIQNPHIAFAVGDSSASTSALSSAASEDYISPFGQPSRPRLRNMKKLSLTLPSAQSSTNSLSMPPSGPSYDSQPSTSPIHDFYSDRKRASVISLPLTTSGPGVLHRKDEGGSPTVPYMDGPIQIIPGVWLGSEENARDWKGLMERGIKSILNVAKEVVSPFDSAIAQPMRPFQSTPNLNHVPKGNKPTYYPAHPASGRPGMHYLKLMWSHGQSDLVETGFPAAMSFTDAALGRGEGVLIHCQCGISRSATLVIALVMRAAATSSSSVPPEVWGLKGMQGAYSFVKEKSKWVGPNMSLIYQLLEYERTLKGGSASPASDRSSNVAEEEEEWGRRRRMLDDDSGAKQDKESLVIMREAQALDKAMEERMEARKSVCSTSSPNGLGMGPAWRSRYHSRKRSGSTASSRTNGSVVSEDLVEEEEHQILLGVGGGFDDESIRQRTPSSGEDSISNLSRSPEDLEHDLTMRQSSCTPKATRLRTIAMSYTPPTAPAHKSSFTLPAIPTPASTIRPTFKLATPSEVKAKGRHRLTTIGLLPPVPPSPDETERPPSERSLRYRVRTESRKPAPPPLHLRKSKPVTSTFTLQHVPTPSQTLFVFPPSPNNTCTPSTMTLTSNAPNAVPFPSMSTPRVATFKKHGRTRSYIGVSAPPTPTTASSRVDARGWIGVEKS